MLKHALVILVLFGVDLNVYLHPNVAVLSMDTTFLLERLSGQMMLVSGFVIAPWRVDIWNAKTKAVGMESTARWKMALGTVILSPKAPVWHWVTPTTTPLTGSTLISRYYSVNTRELTLI